MKKNQDNRRLVHSLAGSLATNWALLGQAVVAKGGYPEDMRMLGEPENPNTKQMVNDWATKLVALGKESREARQKMNLIPPQFAFKCALQPRPCSF
jgi:hypothetical protein